MANSINLNASLGPQFTLQINNGSDFSNLNHSISVSSAQQSPLSLQPVIQNPSLQLKVGVKSSSLLQTGSTLTSLAKGTGIEITANTSLGVYRAITFQGDYVDFTDINKLSSYAGITLKALTVGEISTVLRQGKIEEPSWSFTPNQAIFIGSNGVLTQTPPSLPLRRVGWAVTPTQINLDPYPIIGD